MAVNTMPMNSNTRGGAAIYLEGFADSQAAPMGRVETRERSHFSEPYVCTVTDVHVKDPESPLIITGVPPKRPSTNEDSALDIVQIFTDQVWHTLCFCFKISLRLSHFQIHPLFQVEIRCRR